MKAEERYAELLRSLDDLEASFKENPKRTITLSERETIEGAWMALKMLAWDRDRLVEALKDCEQELRQTLGDRDGADDFCKPYRNLLRDLKEL
jgi:hypothetical protein